MSFRGKGRRLSAASTERKVAGKGKVKLVKGQNFGLSGFDINREVFVYVSADSRIHHWQVSTGKLTDSFTEPNHLNVHYTCLAVGSNLDEETELSTVLLALGTREGAITIWDLKAGAIKKRLGENIKGHRPRIHDLCFSSNLTTLYSTAADGHIIQWDVSTGKQLSTIKADKDISKIALFPGESNSSLLASASSKLVIWDITSKKKVRKFLGNAGAVNNLVWTPDGKYLVTCEKDASNLSCWEFDSDISTDMLDSNEDKIHKLKHQTPIQILTSSRASRFISISSFYDESTYHILSLQESGFNVEVWFFTPSTASNTPQISQHILKLPEGSRGNIISADFCDDSNILVSYGTEIAPDFIKIKYTDTKTKRISIPVTLKSKRSETLVVKDEKKTKKEKNRNRICSCRSFRFSSQ
eukprot:TRINITY_DN1458_c0_g1_i1.p1 TRINITY_DN1458_c0_g1~~TRINITY_DN1458_c0_g1_i1.p1  ORF type:complete len:413 (+),score=75.18 TRINITY_DN1458_c0_g1_i1:45-1283(+)